jgi:hypothetical protein
MYSEITTVGKLVFDEPHHQHKLQSTWKKTAMLVVGDMNIIIVH